ncbi:hypothetical protein HA402_015148 [Bradysia odoriphaga]|nr:hypothetical protein HA402_015148 [Bradysia odoriphaga]
MRQPLGVVAGITPFNFPAMIPLWKPSPQCKRKAFILKKRSESVILGGRCALCRTVQGSRSSSWHSFNVVNGDKDAVDALLDDPDVQAIGFVGSTPIAQRLNIYGRGCSNGKR